MHSTTAVLSQYYSSPWAGPRVHRRTCVATLVTCHSHHSGMTWNTRSWCSRATARRRGCGGHAALPAAVLPLAAQANMAVPAVGVSTLPLVPGETHLVGAPAAQQSLALRRGCRRVRRQGAAGYRFRPLRCQRAHLRRMIGLKAMRAHLASDALC